MVSQQGNNETLETILGETQIESKPLAAAGIAVTVDAAAMERLLQNIQKLPIYPMGGASPTYARPLTRICFTRQSCPARGPMLRRHFISPPSRFHFTRCRLSNGHTFPASRKPTRHLCPPDSNPLV